MAGCHNRMCQAENKLACLLLILNCPMITSGQEVQEAHAMDLLLLGSRIFSSACIQIECSQAKFKCSVPRGGALL